MADWFADLKKERVEATVRTLLAQQEAYQKHEPVIRAVKAVLAAVKKPSFEFIQGGWFHITYYNVTEPKFIEPILEALDVWGIPLESWKTEEVATESAKSRTYKLEWNGLTIQIELSLNGDSCRLVEIGEEIQTIKKYKLECVDKETPSADQS